MQRLERMLYQQTAIENNLKLFLTSFNLENLKEFSGGLCNALAFRSFVSTLIGQKDKNISRLTKVLKMKPQAITELSFFYFDTYLTAYREQTALQDEKLELGKLNVKIKNAYAQLDQLRVARELKEKQKKSLELNSIINQILIIEEEIRIARNRRENIIEENLLKRFGNLKLKKMHDAKDLYYYIQSLAGSHDPKFYYLHKNKIPVQQNDFEKILEVFSPDELLKEVKEQKSTEISVEKVFEISFNFSKSELIKLFNNEFHKNTIRDGDSIAISGATHTIYLSKIGARFCLYIPLPYYVSDAAELVQALQKIFTSPTSYYIPLGISIFSKTNKQKPIIRPEKMKVITTLLLENSDVERVEEDGITALYMAASFGDVNVVDMLIHKGAEINIKKISDGTTPLRMAATLGHNEVVKKLCEQKADPNLRSKDDSSALWFAARYGQFETVKTLCKYKASINHADNNFSETALWTAVSYGHAEVVQELINNGALETTIAGVSTALRAVNTGHPDALEVLASNNFNLTQSDNYGVTPALLAAKKGYSRMLETLFNHQAIKKKDLAKLAFAAATNCHINVIALLMREGFNLKTVHNGQTLASLAANTGDLKLLNFLAKNKALEENKQGESLSIIAAKNRHADVITTLFDNKIDINRPNHTGTFPAHIAAQQGHIKVVSALYERKANLNQANRHGDTPALIAAKNNKAAFIKKLADYKADLNAADRDGLTPLHWAVINTNFSTIRTLLELGANPKLLDKNFKLPLDHSNSDVRYFYILQQLKIRIINASRDQKIPSIANRHLARINLAERANDWAAALSDIKKMAVKESEHINKAKQKETSSLFSSMDKANEDYLKDFFALTAKKTDLDHKPTSTKRKKEH